MQRDAGSNPAGAANIIYRFAALPSGGTFENKFVKLKQNFIWKLKHH